MKQRDAAAIRGRWWDSLASEIPSALPPRRLADWERLQRAAARRRARAGEPGDHEQRAAADANAAHTAMRDALRVMVAGWPDMVYSHGAEDDRLKLHAAKLARWFDAKAQRWRHSGGGDVAALEAIRAEGDSLADLHGVERARSNDKGDAVGVVARYACPRWWRRKLRQAQRLAIEREKIAQGLVGAYRQVYCSDAQVALRGAQLTRNREALEVTKAINEEGQEYTLQELADLSVSNPRIRRSELMVRMRGFEEYARRRDHVAVAVTLTCPSRMHPCDDEYNGISPRDAAGYLSKVWARVRSCLARYGVRVYGFRVAEPHKDGCPHWHMVLFLETEGDARRLEFALLWYGLQVDGDERGAIEHRVKVERINRNATGYLAKYISKGIDGWHEGESSDLFNGMGEGVGFAVVDEDARTGKRQVVGRSVDLAKRVQAWATCYRRRQFQQIGGPPVTLWRELRRVDGNLADWEEVAGPARWPLEEVAKQAGHAEALRAAADGSCWRSFCEVWASWHGGMASGTTPNVPRRWWLARPVYWAPDLAVGGERAPRLVTQYGDARAGQVCGVTLCGEFAGTRWHDWRISNGPRAFEREVSNALAMSALDLGRRDREALSLLRWTDSGAWRRAMRDLRSRAAVALAGGEAALPWRTVNNCTRGDPPREAEAAARRLIQDAIAAGYVSPAPS